jgi:hypothetical protein
LIAKETGLPPAVVGEADVRERHAFVDVAAEHAGVIVGKLNRYKLEDRRLKVKMA